ncbi:MAG: lysophospholipid acyltransferase family protein [Myxococcales bacterium]
MTAATPPPRPAAGRPPFWKRLRREARVRALLLAVPLLSRLPHRLAVAVGGAVGFLAWWLVPKERRLALAHLGIAFPELDPHARARIGRASFVNLGRSALELAAADGFQPRLAAIAELGPAEAQVLREASAAGKGMIFVACHIGNWELLARRVVLAGYRAGTVAREAQDPRLTALLERSRRNAGLQTLWRGKPGLARGLLRLLREGALVGLLIDQDIDAQGQFVPFFGRPAFTPRAAGDLTVRTGAAVIFGCIHREEPTRHRLVIRRLPVPQTGDRERDSLAVTAAATLAIEEEIRRRPDEWVWMHRRWRTKVP